MFGKRIIGKMGIPILGTEEPEMDEPDLYKRAEQKQYKVTIRSQEFFLTGMSIGQALRKAGDLNLLTDDDIVTVRLEK